jgi:hypothetical protein
MMSKEWHPWNPARCDCETEEHEGFCILSPQYRGVKYPKIGTVYSRSVKQTEMEI